MPFSLGVVPYEVLVGPFPVLLRKVSYTSLLCSSLPFPIISLPHLENPSVIL